MAADPSGLATIEPKTAASRRLHELLDGVRDVRARLSQIDVEERQARADARQAAEHVARLQRDAALGETEVTAA